MSSEYKRSYKDEIDFASAEQMHNAALLISKTCFDFKKLCVSFLGVSMAVLIKFTDGSVDHSQFVVGIVLIVGFWFSDANSYFYQRKLRKRIAYCFKCIEIRNCDRKNIEDISDATVSSVSFLQAMFNGSMSLYIIFFILYLTYWFGFYMGWVG